jgi:hypothetical protein
MGYVAIPEPTINSLYSQFMALGSLTLRRKLYHQDEDKEVVLDNLLLVCEHLCCAGLAHP